MKNLAEIVKGNVCEAPYIIAEVAQAHDGSLGQAYSFIKAAADAGADAIKFQTHIADAESHPSEPFRVKFSNQDENRFDYWKRMEFTKEQWIGLKKYAEDCGLEFISSPFSIEACELLNDIGIKVWKLSSGEIHNPVILNYMISTGKPIIASTGMSKTDEIQSFCKKMSSYPGGVAVLQCTTMYPTPLDKVCISYLESLKDYSIPFGLSDHSGTIYPSLLAMARGASIIEVHVTFDKRMFGPDTLSSLTFDELKIVTESSKSFHVMMNSVSEKESISSELAAVRMLFGKSAYCSHPLVKGSKLSMNDVSFKKPGGGLTYDDINDLIGKKTLRDIDYNSKLTLEDFE